MHGEMFRKRARIRRTAGSEHEKRRGQLRAVGRHVVVSLPSRPVVSRDRIAGPVEGPRPSSRRRLAVALYHAVKHPE